MRSRQYTLADHVAPFCAQFLLCSVDMSLSGGYDYQFLEPPPDELLCLICTFVARDPHQLVCCGRVYCKTCLEEQKKRSDDCPQCRKTSPESFQDTRSDRNVKSLKVKCKNVLKGCEWEGEIRNVQEHLDNACAFVLLPCPNDCPKRFQRRNLERHITSECPKRQYRCPHCEEMGQYQERTTTHLDKCPNISVLCRNAPRCKTYIQRSSLGKHQSSCLYEEVPCKYAHIGCESKLLRRNISKHEANSDLHFKMAVQSVSKLHSQMGELEGELKDVEGKLKDVNGEFSELRTQVFSQAPKVIKLAGFSNQSETFHSSPFYTHLGGYKMCISVDTNGFAEAEGTHVSVFAHLMKGKNDDRLQWPFPGIVTTLLLNQLDDKTHHPMTITFPLDSGGRVKGGRRRGGGYGSRKFISRTSLDHNPSKNCQYLKDDCLYFKVSVKIPDLKPWLNVKC